MKATLYQLSKRVETDCNELRSLDDSLELDVTRLQKIFLKEYEGNPVLDDAMQGRQSIEQSVRELGEKNRGIRKVIPWRKDPVHNQRLEHLGELVSGAEHLKTSGISYPDNFITGAAEMGLLLAGLTYLAVKYLFIPDGSLSPAEYQ